MVLLLLGGLVAVGTLCDWRWGVWCVPTRGSAEVEQVQKAAAL
eukprot:SAG31_NODE_45271_length_259_cov_0.968750_1_plen_42_part_10